MISSVEFTRQEHELAEDRELTNYPSIPKSNRRFGLYRIMLHEPFTHPLELRSLLGRCGGAEDPWCGRCTGEEKGHENGMLNNCLPVGGKAGKENTENKKENRGGDPRENDAERA